MRRIILIAMMLLAAMTAAEPALAQKIPMLVPTGPMVVKPKILIIKPKNSAFGRPRQGPWAGARRQAAWREDQWLPLYRQAEKG